MSWRNVATTWSRNYFVNWLSNFWTKRLRRFALFPQGPSSSVTKWGSRISRELFDLELPNFTRIFILIGSTSLPVTSYFRLVVIEVQITIENAAADDLSWNFSRTFRTRTTKFYRCIVNNRSHRKQLNTAQKCIKRVRPAEDSNNSPSAIV